MVMWNLCNLVAWRHDLKLQMADQGRDDLYFPASDIAVGNLGSKGGVGVKITKQGTYRLTLSAQEVSRTSTWRLGMDTCGPGVASGLTYN